MNGATPPTTPDPDEALARLRAADPARGVEPDLDRLRASVAARIDGEQPSTAPVAVGVAAASTLAAAHPALFGDPAPARPDELAARRSPRRWLAVAAVAAGALVVGGAGFGVGSIAAAGRPAGDVITIAQGAPPSTSTGTRAGAAGAEASGDAAASSSRIAPDIYPYWPSRTVFTASGLSDVTGAAPAWTLDAAGVFSAETAERVARALGLEGRATRQYGSWIVGTQDGTGPSLTLSPDGQASVSYYDPTKDPFLCAEVARDDTANAELRRRCAANSSEPAPRGAAAAAQMRQLLGAMGIDATVEIETTEYDVPETGGPRMTTVTAYLVLNGTRAGLTWSATITGAGVQSFYGPVAPLVSLGDYGVVSENEAVRRLGDPRFGSFGGPIIALAEDVARGGGSGVGIASQPPAPGEPTGVGDAAEMVDATGTAIVPEPSDEPTVPPTPEPGSPIAWPVNEVTIVKARLGLTQQWLPNGATVLLPAYELSDADGQTWSVIAVSDAGLDFSPTPQG